MNLDSKEEKIKETQKDKKGKEWSPLPNDIEIDNFANNFFSILLEKGIIQLTFEGIQIKKVCFLNLLNIFPAKCFLFNDLQIINQSARHIP